jgi:hypothetical protein
MRRARKPTLFVPTVKHMKATAGVLMLITAILPGCYRYVPVTVESVSPSETVRARVASGAGSDGTARPQEPRTLEGELLARDDAGFTLFVPAAVRQQGFFTENLRERVRVSSADVIGIERRELDRARTFVLLGAGTAAVVALVIETLSGETGGNTIDRTPPGPAPVRVPVFSLRVR